MRWITSLRARSALIASAAAVAAVVGSLAAATSASAATARIRGTSCTISASGPGPNFGGGIQCGAGAHAAFYKSCVQVRKRNGTWSNTSTCGTGSARLNRSGMGVSFVGFRELSGRSYRVATFGNVNDHTRIVISPGFGTTTIG